MDQDKDNRLTPEQLRQFCGSEIRYQHPLARRAGYTEGVRYLAETGGAYWLIDAIVSHLFTPAMRQAIANDSRLASLQFWRLDVAGDRKAVLTCRADSGETPVVRQEIPFTDFPLDAVDVWCGFDGERWMLYLPSEH